MSETKQVQPGTIEGAALKCIECGGEVVVSREGAYCNMIVIPLALTYKAAKKIKARLQAVIDAGEKLSKQKYFPPIVRILWPLDLPLCSKCRRKVFDSYEGAV